MINNKKHNFHLVDLSPWPILASFTLFTFAISLVMYFHEKMLAKPILVLSFVFLLVILYLWWRDVIQEGVDGHHSMQVQMGLKIGVAVFFLSEICLFGSFFATYFFSSINPVTILDGLWLVESGTWPPKGIKTINPWDIPFINTLILLLSSTTVTWAIYAIEHKKQAESAKALLITVALGIFFLIFQLYEYHHATFSMKDGIYGANFYLTTGFHGIHVLIGTIFLLICYFRAKKGDFVKGAYLGAEFAAWYWHFVDVIWLFLFVFIYVFDH